MQLERNTVVIIALKEQKETFTEENTRVCNSYTQYVQYHEVVVQRTEIESGAAKNQTSLY